MRLFLGLFCNKSWGLNNVDRYWLRDLQLRWRWWHGHWAGQTLQRMWNSWSTTFSLERFVFFSPWIYQDADCRVARDKRLTLSSTKSSQTHRCSHQDINGTEPESWPKKLKTIQVSPFRNINNFIAQAALSWDPKDQPFANISAQRCNDTILQVTIEVSIQRRRCNE